ncbi:hypothetical protein CEXT_489571 [Caerostris extrusa]|uniref:Uncharacterized protein n=1 Tax=Caerostris extrusa TaxID=172846 RepID=A0AAV4TFX5_CAEEX|nr:hypothetical protein CEXT_489571 [Caerostris extrusa]
MLGNGSSSASSIQINIFPEMFRSIFKMAAKLFNQLHINAYSSPKLGEMLSPCSVVSQGQIDSFTLLGHKRIGIFYTVLSLVFIQSDECSSKVKAFSVSTLRAGEYKLEN